MGSTRAPGTPNGERVAAHKVNKMQAAANSTAAEGAARLQVRK
jgi:hypothetical protein